jgi:hypothetical protein
VLSPTLTVVESFFPDPPNRLSTQHFYLPVKVTFHANPAFLQHVVLSRSFGIFPLSTQHRISTDKRHYDILRMLAV